MLGIRYSKVRLCSSKSDIKIGCVASNQTGFHQSYVYRILETGCSPCAAGFPLEAPGLDRWGRQGMSKL